MYSFLYVFGQWAISYKISQAFIYISTCEILTNWFKITFNSIKHNKFEFLIDKLFINFVEFMPNKGTIP